MTVCIDQPPQGFVGTFLVGTRTVGSIRYQDALCGSTTCGYSISGMWWAYLCPTGLLLGGVRPADVDAGTPAFPPDSGLSLGGRLPGLAIDTTLDAPQAGLSLGARLPVLTIDEVIDASPAGLALGGYTPDSVAQTWLFDAPCIEDDLVEADCTTLALTSLGVTSFDLEPEVCR